MKIAFASKDGINVNEHFGWCEKFYIYELDKDDYTLISEIDSSLKFDEEVDKLEYKINCLEDSDIVYVTQIGPKAANMVKSTGIYPMKSSTENEKIEDVLIALKKLINNNPPLWLQRILLK
ncbi:MAG: NifB/NifX family molybdenum-iron cluster-binding protein [Arcobacteraceae bacterium]|jgi:nitrogen fixation protein NifX|nr:NifB/NifX family molybdenum-iron cluster-binding protein [Arcobacteraceae bacterium]